jgi:hypothetical protein
MRECSSHLNDSRSLSNYVLSTCAQRGFHERTISSCRYYDRLHHRSPTAMSFDGGDTPYRQMGDSLEPFDEHVLYQKDMREDNDISLRKLGFHSCIAQMVFNKTLHALHQRISSVDKQLCSCHVRTSIAGEEDVDLERPINKSILQSNLQLTPFNSQGCATRLAGTCCSHLPISSGPCEDTTIKTLATTHIFCHRGYTY